MTNFTRLGDMEKNGYFKGIILTPLDFGGTEVRSACTGVDP